MSIIEFKNVSFSYEKNIEILKDLNFIIKEGESIGLVGANGAGKSTLMKLLLGLELDYEGEIIVSGFQVNKKNLKDIRKKAGFIMQSSDNQLFCHTVYEDICFGPKNYGFSNEEIEKRAQNAMEAVGCEKLKDKAVYKLSGGEKKLAAIATILAMEPEIIIMDEPESNLDPLNRKRLLDITNSLEKTKIIASHDLDFIWESCETVLLLGDGMVRAYGATKEILTDETLLNKYSLMVPNCAIIEQLTCGITPSGSIKR